MAGHRDTFFCPLRKIEPHDEIIFDTAAHTYHYRVSFTEIVDPHDVAVLKPGKKNFIT
jgi:sortase A